ncbi:MAG: phenylalanine--tRNA ligase subunit alpha, partial [Anaerovorax sp.]
MQNKTLLEILQEAKDQLEKVNSIAETEDLRVRFLGKKSPLTELLRSMGTMEAEARKEFGKEANAA